MSKITNPPPTPNIEGWLATNVTCIGQRDIASLHPPREAVEGQILELLLFWDDQSSRTIRKACRNEINRLVRGLHDRGHDIREVFDRLEERLPADRNVNLLSCLLDKAFDGIDGWWS